MNAVEDIVQASAYTSVVSSNFLGVQLEMVTLVNIYLLRIWLKLGIRTYGKRLPLTLIVGFIRSLADFTTREIGTNP